MAISSAYIAAMSVVKVSDLKNRLSHYLRIGPARRVGVGQRSRSGHCPHRACRRLSSTANDNARWLDDLERRGVVRRGTGKLPRGLVGSRPKLKADVVGALLQERRDGRRDLGPPHRFWDSSAVAP